LQGKNNDGLILACKGNIQFGFLEDQYQGMLISRLRAMREEPRDDTSKFYQSRNGDYQLQSHVLMLVKGNQTGVALPH
jgi:hypothetical protein